jgi:hypothetical protein
MSHHRGTHTASLPRNLSECLMLSLSRRMTSFRSGRSNQVMAPAIASTMNNTALWLRSAPLANVLVANGEFQCTMRIGSQILTEVEQQSHSVDSILSILLDKYPSTSPDHLSVSLNAPLLLAGCC